MIVLEPSVIPKGQSFQKEKKHWGQPRTSVAGKGWQSYFSFSVSERTGTEAEVCHSFKTVKLFNKDFISFFTKPLSLEFVYGQ